MKKRTFRSQAYYAEAIERVWRALTDPAELSQWLTNGNFKAQRGHRFKWKEVDPSQAEDPSTQGPHSSQDASFEDAICEIQEVEAPHRLVYRLEHSAGSSIVTWSLDTVGEGTQLIIEQELVISSNTSSDASAQLRLHPNVVSLAAYRRQRSLLKHLGEQIKSQEHSSVCKEAA
jgi:uncharacterized protein YndB with AHSA1/START domain